MSWFRALIAAVALTLLTACGFTPLYGTGTPQAAFASVEITNIPDREGQYLRNALIDRLYAQNGRPRNAAYILSASKINAQRNELGVRKDATATHIQLRLETTLKLTDSRSGAVVLERDLRSYGAYNVFDSQYATMTAENAAREQALSELADQICQELALYFRKAGGA